MAAAGAGRGLEQQADAAAGPTAGATAAGRGAGPAWYAYWTNAELEAWGRNFTSHAECGRISRFLDLGTSTQGTERIWALEISDRPGEAEPEPAVRLVGNLHGDEPLGRQFGPYYADWLCRNHRTDPRARRMVTELKTFILPSANPDGFKVRPPTPSRGRKPPRVLTRSRMEAHRRGNARLKDLNRNFPDPMRNGARLADLRPRGQEEKETRLLMDWSQSLRVTGSLNFHEGAIVANYPNDGYKELGGKARYSACPDDATFVHLAKLYAGAHAFMSRSKEFKDGITNGSRWYPVYGGMQDWMYYAARMFELTLEVSQKKWPAAALLRKNWEDNFPAIVAFAEEIGFRGLHGRVYDVTAGKGEAQRRPLDAFVEVEGIAWVATSGERFGDYHRPLAPGRYRISAFRPGYTKQTVEVTLAPGDRWVQVSASWGERREAVWVEPGRFGR